MSCKTPSSSRGGLSGRLNLTRSASSSRLLRRTCSRLAVAPRSKEQILVEFRQKILQRFRSLYDAFARIGQDLASKHSLPQEEFRLAFARLGVNEAASDELFAAIDARQTGCVSLLHVRYALVNGSQDSLLWELRCRLSSAGITPHDSRKAFDLARKPKHRKMRERRQPQDGFSATADVDVDRPLLEAGPVEAELEASDADMHQDDVTVGCKSRTGFRRCEWLRLCAELDLTLLEAERLFTVLRGDETGSVKYQEMFELIRTHVAPDVSLERFAAKAIARYGSLAASFQAVCATVEPQTERVLRWSEFHALAVALDVNDRSAAKLWSILVQEHEKKLQEDSLHDNDSAVQSQHMHEDEAWVFTDDEACDIPVAISEDAFVQLLAVWAPATAIDALKNQLCERFGSLAESKRALARKGHESNRAPMSPEKFAEVLKSAEISCCDAKWILTAIASLRGAKRSPVTLNDVFEAMRVGGQCYQTARNQVKDDTLPVWQQLWEVKADLQNEDTLHARESFARIPSGTAVSRGARGHKRRGAICRIEGLRPHGMHATASLPSLRPGRPLP